MGRPRNNTQSKGKEESPQRVLDETEARNLSDMEFKIMVIRMLKELSENHMELYGSYTELTGKYISMKKDVETINNSQEVMKNTISEENNTLEGSKSMLDEAED